jgi:putative ABC transport system permease protein
MKIALRSIPRRKLRNSLTVLGIIIAVALPVGVDIAAESSFVEFRNYIQAAGGKIDIVVATISGAPFEQRKVESSTAGLPYVQAAGRVSERGLVKREGQTKGVSVTGVDQLKDFQYRDYTFEGTGTLRRNDATIGQKMSEDLGIKLGDYVTIQRSDGSTLSIRVVGIVKTSLETGYNVYIDLAFAQQKFGYVGRVTYAIVHVTDETRLTEVRKMLERNLGESYSIKATKEETISFVLESLAGWRQGLSSISTVAVLVSIGLVLNTMYMNLGERTYEVGVLRAIGARRRDVFWLFFSETIFYALIGIAVGLAAGVGFARIIYSFTSVVSIFGAESTGTLAVRPEYLISGATTGFLATIVGGFLPSLSAARTGILSALKPGIRAPGKQRTAVRLLLAGIPLATIGGYISTLGIEVGSLDIALLIIGLVMVTSGILRVGEPLIERMLSPFKAVGKLLSKNLGRNLRRAAITYAVIAMCIAFLVMMGGMRVGMEYAVRDTVTSYFGADIMVFAGSRLPASFSKSIVQVDPAAIEAVTSMDVTATKSGNTQIGVISVDPDTFPLVFNKLEFSEDTPRDVYVQLKNNLYSILLVEPLANSLKVKVGQQIPVRTPAGSVKLTVIGVLRGAGLTMASIGGVRMSQSGFVSLRTGSTFFLESAGAPKAMLFYVKLRAGSDAIQVKNKIHQKFGTTYELEMITVNDLMTEVETQSGRFFVVFDVIVYMAIISATAGISATMLMNVNERRREIGMLRSQGMSNTQIFALVVAEAVFLGLAGYVVGSVAGVFLLRGVVSLMSGMGLVVPYIVPWERLQFALILAIGISVAGVIYPSFRATRVNLIEVLRYRG